MSFEASDYALVVGLNMCSEIGLEILDTDILKAIRNDMTREVVLKEEDFTSLFSKFSIPLQQPVLIEVSGHPCLCIVLVIKSKLGTCLLVKSSWACSLANDKWWKLLRPIGI